jgi:hypothetical protein
VEKDEGDKMIRKFYLRGYRLGRGVIEGVIYNEDKEGG